MAASSHIHRVKADIASQAAALAARWQLRAACVAYEQAIEMNPSDPQLHCRLAACQWRLGLLQAEASFRIAIGLNPQFAMAHAALAAWYLQQGLVEMADISSKKAIELSPDDNDVMQSRVVVLEAMGQMDAAWEMVEKLIARRFTPMPLVRLYGRMARYRDAQLPALALVQRKLTAANQSAMDLARLHFTAAELLDSLGRFDEAFDHARLGNKLARNPYDLALHQRTFNLLIEYFTRDRIASLPRATDRSDRPVFIVGMPRAGSSLVEQMLASHPDIHGAGELDFMPNLCRGLIEMLGARPQQYPSALDRLTVDQADGMAQIYLQPLIAMNPSASRITDKLPLNFLHLGLIALLLPGARVIDCRRDPRDVTLSNYMAMYEGGNDFKFDLNHIAHFQIQYRRLMEHWKQSLPVPILEVNYEDLVTNPEAQIRRMLEFLGLPWDARCLDFHQNNRAVNTSSLQQVRRPLYASSIHRWRNYRRHLPELDRWFK